MSESESRDQRKSWDDLIFSTLEKIAATPGKLKDPKDSISGAFEWVRGLREEAQDRIKEEVSARIGKLDWNQLAERVGDHLAKKYQIKVSATVEWVPKEQPTVDVNVKPPEDEVEI